MYKLNYKHCKFYSIDGLCDYPFVILNLKNDVGIMIYLIPRQKT